jgi:hypothetical protein
VNGNLSAELNQLQHTLQGELHTGTTMRTLYANDASAYCNKKNTANDTTKAMPCNMVILPRERERIYTKKGGENIRIDLFLYQEQ